jgi:HEAT repeat protein
LKNPDPLVRQFAAHDLGKVGSLSPAPEAFAALRAAVRDQDAVVRQAVAEACECLLGRATKEDVPTLVTVLKDAEPFVRWQAARALGKVGSVSDTPEALAALKKAAEDKDPDVRRAAIKACELLLVDRATKDDGPALIAALKDTEPFIRRHAARALGKVGSLSTSPEAFAALRAAARDQEAVVREAVAEASESLLGRATKEDVPTLATALKDTEPFVRLAAARALGKVGSVSVAPDLIAALKDPDPFVRLNAGRALGEVASISVTPEALAALKETARDKDPDVRGAALEACERLLVDRATKEDLPALLAALKDAEPFVRRLAVRALGKVGSISVSPEVLAALKEGAKDKDPDVRGAATQAWETIPPSLINLALDPPLVEAYLRQGRFVEGEAALLERLKASPTDDQARFGLGVLRFVRGVERLGQSLHRYGARSENTNIPFLRLPVPRNPEPAPIDDDTLRRVLDDFRRDLATAEATLGGVTDVKVKLPLRLALVHLDLDGDGKATDRLLDILKRIMQQRLDFLDTNPDFVVCFDRGDVAWLRAYCHLLMGMLDFYLAFDTGQLFEIGADDLFAKPKKPIKEKDKEKLVIPWVSLVLAVKEPARLGQFRKHLLEVVKLNRETWRFIRAETDDDHEWLPNPKQKGVFGLPVRNEMIDAWLEMMGELEALLEGKKTFVSDWGFGQNEKGLNLKTLFDNPPEKLELSYGFPQNLPEKYFSQGKEVNIEVVFRVLQVFGGDTTAFAYGAWFN